MEGLIDFNLGDTVCIGNGGDKVKIVNIERPLGTYKMYTVQTYNGDFHKVARHQLLKGLPDEAVFDSDTMELFNSTHNHEVHETESHTFSAPTNELHTQPIFRRSTAPGPAPANLKIFPIVDSSMFPHPM